MENLLIRHPGYWASGEDLDGSDDLLVVELGAGG